jgi:hypothetical protein
VLLLGWVLLIGSEYEQCRVLVALLVSICFLSLQFAIRPLRRHEDSAIMFSVQLALILIFTSVLLVKACDMDSLTARYSDAEAIAKVVCARFGFGDSGQGASIAYEQALALPSWCSCTAKITRHCSCNTLLLFGRRGFSPLVDAPQVCSCFLSSRGLPCSSPSSL